jgi:hypothetical protein
MERRRCLEVGARKARPEPDFARGLDKESEASRNKRPDYARGLDKEPEDQEVRDKYDTDFAKGIDREDERRVSKRRPDYARGEREEES